MSLDCHYQENWSSPGKTKRKTSVSHYVNCNVWENGAWIGEGIELVQYNRSEGTIVGSKDRMGRQGNSGALYKRQGQCSGYSIFSKWPGCSKCGGVRQMVNPSDDNSRSYSSKSFSFFSITQFHRKSLLNAGNRRHRDAGAALVFCPTVWQL